MLQFVSCRVESCKCTPQTVFRKHRKWVWSHYTELHEFTDRALLRRSLTFTFRFLHDSQAAGLILSRGDIVAEGTPTV